MPENVTLLPKTTSLANGGGDWSERMVTAKKGETVGSILRELGAAPDEIKQINAVFGPLAADGGIKDGQRLRVLMAPAGPWPHTGRCASLYWATPGSRPQRRCPTPADTFRSTSKTSMPAMPPSSEPATLRR